MSEFNKAFWWGFGLCVGITVYASLASVAIKVVEVLL
jgi:hypothetical protein